VTDTNWVMEWMKVLLLWLLYYGVHYFCWVRYPPPKENPPRRWIDELWEKDRRWDDERS
jgi:hypothetical protein